MMSGISARSALASPACVRCGQRAGWIAVWANAALGVLKVVVGLAAGSHACVADALASGLNVFTAFSIFISRKLTGKPVDELHPYGYGKAEFIAAGAVAAIVSVLTLVMVGTTIKHIFYQAPPTPHVSAMLIALVSVASNEMMFRYFRCVGTALRSQTIIANAWANRGEAFGSFAVVLGVLGAQLGFHHLDPIASIVVSGIILRYSIGIIRDAVAGLMDRSLSEESMQQVREMVTQVPEVREVRQARARLLGNKIWVDLVVGIDRSHTVQACEALRERIQDRVRTNLPEVEQVLVDFEVM